MWQTQSKEVNKGQVIQYQLLEDGKVMSFRQVIHHWRETPIFRSYYNDILAEAPFQAFFWEVMPISLKELDREFEFVLVNSSSLARVRANKSAFQEHFTQNVEKEVISFPNLRGDAQLVVPTPQKAEQYYAHLANVARNASDSQIDALWKMVGEEYERKLEEKPKWLSTAGLGVFWLHIRIDSRPKYYRYRPYKQH